DIGYNYVIDQDGRVYEGRYGGDGVVAGHAYGYNTGSIGIALLGNYQTNELPAPMVKTLTGLIYEKSELNGIDPDSSGLFRGKVLPNIIGHRDVGKTACPGDYTYDYIPEIRKVVGDALDTRRHTNFNNEYSYEEVGRRELITLDPQSSTKTRVTIKNTGTVTWNNSTYLKASASASDSNVLTVTQAKMDEFLVAPGKTATFDLTLSTALYGGLVNYDLSPVFNGSEKVLNYLDLAAFVSRPMLEFDLSSSKVDSTILKPEKTSKVTVKLKNTGNVTWKNSGGNAIKLSRTGSSSLVSTDELATLKESSVAPGSTGTFEFTITAPKTGGKYSLYYAPSMDNSNAFVSGSGSISVTVTPTNSDAEISETSGDLTFTPGEKKSFRLKITNYSDTTWKASGAINKLTFGLTKNTAIIVSDPKLAVNSLAPGMSSGVNFSITAPARTGDYSIYIRPRVNGRNLMTQPYILKIKVASDVGATGSGYMAAYTTPIRIKLTPDSAITPIITSNSRFSVYDNLTLLKNFSADSRIRVTQNGDKFSVTSGSYSYSVKGPVRLTPESGGIMQISTMDQRPAWNTSLNDDQFRGTIEVGSVDGELTLINELALEDYMKGIGEVSNGDPTEKIKTMMVIARTYAKYYLSNEKFPGKPYNLDDDPNNSQKYLGYGFELRSPNVAAAATSTAGEVVTYGGKTVITPYFTATDGTRTKSALSVWGWTDTPWLVSVSDAVCTTSANFQGHGVGLSGCGASAMANSGKTYLDIIRYYYTGVDVQKL
ncbi:MAG: N-acetylmuramoyl-L-alanine amidase, partial [Parcubacteria group bacterium]|nr:N-acetylmuramoyl-L-alanine amidase [Parcubacteria group bacterium]